MPFATGGTIINGLEISNDSDCGIFKLAANAKISVVKRTINHAILLHNSLRFGSSLYFASYTLLGKYATSDISLGRAGSGNLNSWNSFFSVDDNTINIFEQLIASDPGVKSDINELIFFVFIISSIKSSITINDCFCLVRSEKTP